MGNTKAEKKVTKKSNKTRKGVNKKVTTTKKVNAKQSKTSKNIKTINKQKTSKLNTKKPQQKKILKKETILVKINSWLKKRGLSPIISVILLVVVSVILVIAILSWGKNFTTESTKNTNDITKLKPSDATYYVYPKTTKDGVIEFNYSPPNALAKEELIIQSYIVANIPEMTEPIEFENPKKLSNTNILELPCLYEYASTTPDLYIQLITDRNTYIDIKIKDQGMVCVSSGDGTEDEPYVICTANDLNNIRDENLSKNYVLGKDIDLGCFSKESSEGWVPIGFDYYNSFTGIFDGQNHTINNLYINRPEEDNVGLFGYIGYAESEPEIKNLKLKDVNVSGNNNVGGLAGENYRIIENCSATGVVSGNDYVGVLVGSGGAINSYATGDVSGNNNVGGLVGSGGAINSYATGDVSGNNNVGGLVGSGGAINSYATGNVSGNWSVGGLVGDSFMNDINQSYSTGDVNGNNSIGGLVGSSSYSNIENSYSISNTKGKEYVGGLIGFYEGAQRYIRNSYALGNVTGEDKVGGLIGRILGAAYISNCYAAGQIISEPESIVGGFVAETAYFSWGTITNCFWDVTVAGPLVGAGGEGKTTVEMLKRATYNDWIYFDEDYNQHDFDDTWEIIENKTYPYLKNNKPKNLPLPFYGVVPNYAPGNYGKQTMYIELSSVLNKIYYTTDNSAPSCSGVGKFYNNNFPIEITTGTTTIKAIACEIGKETSVQIFTYILPEPIIINTPQDLDNIRNNLDGFYVLGANINLGVAPYNTGDGWEPIGNMYYDPDSEEPIENPFTGGFDGAGHTINNLYIDNSDFDLAAIGLFGYVKNATITNVHLENINVSGGAHVGGLVGLNQIGTIENSYATGTVNGNYSIGGLVGVNYEGTIENSYAAGTVNGNYSIGGLVGENMEGTIENSYATGTVTGDGLVGGLVGHSDGYIENSYATGEVNGTVGGEEEMDYVTVGGLVGSNGGTIENSYATGEVSGYWDVGGLVGDNWGIIKNSYAIGLVGGVEEVGGLVGYNEEEGGIIQNSYWDTETSGRPTSAGGIGKTTAQMKQQNTFAGWNFNDVWKIEEGVSYPYLKNNEENLIPIILSPSSCVANCYQQEFKSHIINPQGAYSCSWSSDKHGIFGSECKFTNTFLFSVGNHIITLSVTDTKQTKITTRKITVTGGGGGPAPQ